MCITSNCRQIWHPNQTLNLIVSSIVGGVNEQNSIVYKCCADDWTVEISTITSNVSVLGMGPIVTSMKNTFGI